MIKYTYKSLLVDILFVILLSIIIEIIFNLIVHPQNNELYSQLLFFKTLIISIFNTTTFELFKPAHLNHYLTLGISRTELIKLSYIIQIPVNVITLLPAILFNLNHPTTIILLIVSVALLISFNAYSVHDRNYGKNMLAINMLLFLSNNITLFLLIFGIYNMYLIYQNKKIFMKGNLV